VDEDESRADEEMGAYVRRQYSKKLSAGMSEEAIRKMFEFPDPTDPLPPLESKGDFTSPES
jgi:dual specificity tyrosine-phosphorylation-regulated kinase 2/3/4